MKWVAKRFYFLGGLDLRILVGWARSIKFLTFFPLSPFVFYFIQGHRRNAHEGGEQLFGGAEDHFGMMLEEIFIAIFRRHFVKVVEVPPLDIVFVGEGLPDDAELLEIFAEIFEVLIREGPEDAIFLRDDGFYGRDLVVEAIDRCGDVPIQHQPDANDFTGLLIFLETAEKALFDGVELRADLAGDEQLCLLFYFESLGQLEDEVLQLLRHWNDRIQEGDELW
jgi:hypothetical protein